MLYVVRKGKPVYAIIGDVHGCLQTLLALLKALPESTKPIFVGDLIDRGPEDKKVVDLVKEGGYPCVMGNHEHFAVDAYRHTHIYKPGWWENGCGGKGVKYFGPERLEWMEKLPLSFASDIQDSDGNTLLVTHAPVLHDLEFATNPKLLANSRHDDRSCLWYRGKPSRQPRVFQVFGHTPLRTVEVKDHYANVDTGCIYGFTEGDEKRTLAALLWPSKKVVSVPYQDGKEEFKPLW